MTTITLDTPIKRGETEITEITLRKPSAGALRGLSTYLLVTSDVDSILKILPRITTPTLTADEAQRLDIADLTVCAMEIASFLLPKRLQQAPDGLEKTSSAPTA